MKINNGKKISVMILACGSLFSSLCSANSVNIDINGTVVASPCVVNGNQSSLQVKLGDTIQADSLAASGSVTNWSDFTLALTSCPASTSSFSVTFSGDTDTDVPTNYKNTGTATNLSLELTTGDGTTKLSNGTALNNVAIPSTHAYNLAMRARAVSKGNVIPGSIIGQVQATFTYQ